MSSFTALYDACVLYPAPLRDLLVSLGGTGLFRAKWSGRIHEEWISSLLRERPDLNRETLERTRKLMDQSVLDCLVTNFEDLIPSLTLPDENDRHVLAAAIRGRCDVIVTFNLKDFPARALVDYSIEAQHPDDFIAYMLDLHPGLVCETLRQMRARLQNPAKSPEEFLGTLERQGLAETVGLLHQFKGVL